MKVIQHFDNQDYQLEAVESIVDIFAGQSFISTDFNLNLQQSGIFTEYGYGNPKLGSLNQEQMLHNLRAVQDKYQLTRSKELSDSDYTDIPNFTVEMETGTGKTYVYTRTILELYKRYGMTKFIIVVPSIAIRAGVYESLEATKAHFQKEYPGISYRHFIYDSSRITEVRDFASSGHIQIMIMNIDAFRSSLEGDDSKRIIDKPILSGRTPISLIQSTNPIVILDEPQSIDNTELSKQAIIKLNPLSIIRYSATHRKTYNLVYKLGPIQAYQKNLVKKVAVTGRADTSLSYGYLKLLRVIRTPAGKVSAEILLNKYNSKGVAKIEKVKADMTKNRNLFDLSGKNEMYRGLVITNMSYQESNEWIEFEGGRLLKAQTEQEDLELVRVMIQATIEKHLDREAQLLAQGIKVLSLFFLDKVNNYREYDDNNQPLLGRYGQIFEEEYSKAIKQQKYNTLFQDDIFKSFALNPNVSMVHEGYFSIDKKGVMKDSKGLGVTKDDQSTYDKIVKNKSELLSLTSSLKDLRFIFSHSALKEGWDNPNVFQICTLVQSNDDMTRRQKIGRGLRLPLNQEGKRIQDENINILTVIANESYQQFAETFQREIEEQTGTKFGLIEPRFFEGILFDATENIQLSYEDSAQIQKFLLQNQYIDHHHKATPKLREDLKSEKQTQTPVVKLPEKFEVIRSKILEQIETVLRIPTVSNADGEIRLNLNKHIYLDSEFKTLWDKIKYKTRYHIDFDSEDFITEAVSRIDKGNEVRTRNIEFHTANLGLHQKGVQVVEEVAVNRYNTTPRTEDIPNPIEYLSQYTRLKKQTLVKILQRVRTLKEFHNNPQYYLEQASAILNDLKKTFISDGVKYQKIGDNDYYSQELFEKTELTSYLYTQQQRYPAAFESSKNIFDHVELDSGVEKSFLDELEKRSDVKLYAKLPNWFKIDTPLGNYNPDWAILIDRDGQEKLYFVVETKGSAYQLDGELRGKESQKINCAKKHFKALDTAVKYEVTDSMNKIG